MRALIAWLFSKKQKPQPELPDPFDVDLEGAYLDGPSALRAEKRVDYYYHKYGSDEWKAAYEKQKKRHDNAILPPKRSRTTDEFDADQKQYYTWEAAKRGVPMHEWKEGKHFSQTSGYVVGTQYWKDPEPLAPHYKPGLSKFRKAKTDEWRGLAGNNWFNHSTATEQPLGGHLQVVQDHSTKITYHYCQKGHLHEYHNGVLIPGNSLGTQQKSKHLTFPKPHPFDWSKSYGSTDKTIVESPDCD
jgi:hypothetical protein